jgi:uncharacterized membrane protein YqhA
MFKFKDSDKFIKSGDFIFPKDEIALLDCSDIENLQVKILLKSNVQIMVSGIHALELVMQVKPSMIEGRRLKWPKFVWFIHNMFGHPLTQLFALIRCYKIAFWIHDITVPKAIIKNSKN